MTSDPSNLNPHWQGDSSNYEDFLEERGLIEVPISALDIIWGNEDRFWQVNYKSDGERGLHGFEDGALLVQVNWLEVTGTLPMSIFRRDSVSKYKIYYVVSFNEDAFGWHSAEITFKVRLEPIGNKEPVINWEKKKLESYRKKPGEWHEIPGVEFSFSDTVTFVEFGMYEVETAWWKGGMVLAGVLIKPVEEDQQKQKEASQK